MKPTIEETAGLTTVDQVAEWGGLRAGEGPDNIRRNLFGTLGLQGDERKRVVANIPVDDSVRLLDAWRFGGMARTAAQRSQGGCWGWFAAVSAE